jgi:predicted amidophosphoribosyltransferase
MENIKGAFKCVNPGAVKDKKIILIDDVSTTSSTLSECAKEFSKAGAKEIWGLVLARG